MSRRHPFSTWFILREFLGSLEKMVHVEDCHEFYSLEGSCWGNSKDTFILNLCNEFVVHKHPIQRIQIKALTFLQQSPTLNHAIFNLYSLAAMPETSETLKRLFRLFHCQPRGIALPLISEVLKVMFSHLNLACFYS